VTDVEGEDVPARWCDTTATRSSCGCSSPCCPPRRVAFPSVNEPDLSTAELRAALVRLIDAIEDRFGERMSIPEDYYWNVPLAEATVLDRNPTLDMGSVVDDVDSVREFLTQDPEEFLSIWHQADHLAGVLRAIARRDLAP
jgi:hypothetical protein